MNVRIDVFLLMQKVYVTSPAVNNIPTVVMTARSLRNFLSSIAAPHYIYAIDAERSSITAITETT